MHIDRTSSPCDLFHTDSASSEDNDDSDYQDNVTNEGTGVLSRFLCKYYSILYQRSLKNSKNYGRKIM